MTKRAFKYRFYPTDEQKRLLAQTFGCCRFTYKFGLSTRSTAYKERGEKLSYNDLSALLPDLKKQYPWLADVSSVPLQQALRHLDQALKNFFAGHAEYPHFKCKQNSQSATYASNAFTLEGHTLTLAKMDTALDIHWHRDLPKEVKASSVTIRKDCANRYFVSILVEEEVKALPVINKIVGLDLGLKSLVITSDGGRCAIRSSLPGMRKSWQRPNVGMPGKRRAPKTETRPG